MHNISSYWILNKVNTLTQVHFHLRNVKNNCFDTLGRMGKGRGISTWLSVCFQPVESWQSSLSKPRVLKVFKTNGGGQFPGSLRSSPSPAGDRSHETAKYLPPSLLPRCWRGFGDVDGLLQGSPQVHSPLLDHLANVLYPVLLVLNTGRLCRRESHQEAVPFPPVPSTCSSPLLPNFPSFQGTSHRKANTTQFNWQSSRWL